MEKREAIKTAEKYVAAAADGRDPDSPIVQVAAGAEPAMFTANFTGWDAELFARNKFEDPYEKKLRLLREEKDKAAREQAAADRAAAEAQAAAEAEARAKADEAEAAAASGGFSLTDLQSVCPEGVDPAKKEMYLSDADFQSVFGMDKAAWEKMPAWKRKNKKKEAKLF